MIETAGSYEPPEEVTFTAGDTTATLTVLTEDDEQQEGDGAVIATLQPGAGYRLGGASTQSAQVTVEDNEGGGVRPVRSVPGAVPSRSQPGAVGAQESGGGGWRRAGDTLLGGAGGRRRLSNHRLRVSDQQDGQGLDIHRVH